MIIVANNYGMKTRIYKSAVISRNFPQTVILTTYILYINDAGEHL